MGIDASFMRIEVAGYARYRGHAKLILQSLYRLVIAAAAAAAARHDAVPSSDGCCDCSF